MHLQETTERLLAECASCIVDLAGVTQVDARGLGVLAELVGRARAAQRSFRVINVNDRVRAALRLTRLDEVLELTSESERAAANHRAVA